MVIMLRLQFHHQQEPLQDEDDLGFRIPPDTPQNLSKRTSALTPYIHLTNGGVVQVSKQISVRKPFILRCNRGPPKTKLHVLLRHIYCQCRYMGFWNGLMTPNTPQKSSVVVGLLLRRSDKGSRKGFAKGFCGVFVENVWQHHRQGPKTNERATNPGFL